LAFDPQCVDILDRYLNNGQIDVYPKKGKRGGAYCWGGTNLPTFILLNHVDSIRSIETFAHEMGHAIHTEFSKSQPNHYERYVFSTAEVASTFFEQMVSNDIEAKLPKSEQIALLHNRLLGDMSTIFRQVACFNFELELHQAIRNEGQLGAEKIAAMLAKHLKSYLGDVFDVDALDGYFFVNWSHIRRFFYVYTYAYGQIVSRALYKRWREDPSYSKKIIVFLKAGGSMSPEDIFKSIGIDVSSPKFFSDGLKSIEKDIAKLEKLTK
jgi:oligoendopeptidase F